MKTLRQIRDEIIEFFNFIKEKFSAKKENELICDYEDNIYEDRNTVTVTIDTKNKEIDLVRAKEIIDENIDTLADRLDSILNKNLSN